MDLERPDWFERVGEWWDPVVGGDVARHVQPVGVSADGRLAVLCSNPAWTINMRLLALRLTERFNETRAAGVPELTGISVLRPPQIPDEITQQWADLVGADLAEQILLDSLTDWGQELVTEAESAQARDLLARRAPVVLARLRAALLDTTIVRLSESRLRPVSVLVVSSPDFSDRQLLENVLLDTWHDAVETVGPGHLLRLQHAGQTAADQMVEDWATQANGKDPSSPWLVQALEVGTNPDWDGPDDTRRSDLRFVARQPDLCLVFGAREDEELPLAELARERGMSVWQHVQ
ncbi:DciA family protein [Streptomyces europaeiscabiei]|uniref:DciA family protein n=1 Tax=Streptomyces europaeiscabiei TaxID=146819 RepID=UPI0038F6188A